MDFNDENRPIMSGDRLSTRTISGYPLSIATAHAFLAMFSPRTAVYDPAREIPSQVDVNKYSECWINVTTLFRNMVGAIQKEAFVKSTEKEFKDTLLSEMEVIDGLFQNEGMGVCKPMYYYTTHEKLVKSLPEQVKLREDKTDTQKAYAYKMHKTLEYLMKETEVVRKFDTNISPPGASNALIITHIPYDLVSYNRFNKLSLLESHTGKLKERNQWYTKYYAVGDSDLSHIPFMRKLLLIFGDSVLIQPSVYKLRKQIVDIATKRNWTPLTTLEKVMMDLEYEIHEPYVIGFLKSL